MKNGIYNVLKYQQHYHRIFGKMIKYLANFYFIFRGVFKTHSDIDDVVFLWQ